MKTNKKWGSRMTAYLLSAALAISCFPAFAYAKGTENAEAAGQEDKQGTAAAAAQAGEQTATKAVSPETDLVLGSQAVLTDNDRGGKAVHINTSWVDTKKVDSLTESAAFRDPGCFHKQQFTLYMNVYRLENGGNADHASKVAFSVGNESNYFNLRLANKGSLAGSFGTADFTKNPTKDRAFSAVALSYSEDASSGKVSVYIDGEKVLDRADIGCKLSEIDDLKANIGSGRGTGFMVEGIYDDIRIADEAVAADRLEPVCRYQPYHTFSGVRNSYGGLLGSSVKVAEWLDTAGNHIQAHGGQVQWLDTLDLDEDGTPEGGWIWYGEDKSRNGKPIDGIHCYTSPDLYNWTDRGMALFTHDILPDKLNGAGDGIVQNDEGLASLKAWAAMDGPSEEASAEQIFMAKNFLSAYRTADGYEEENLAKAFHYLYSGYCIAERPKMLYNENSEKYVLVFHADGPSDENILKYLKDNSAFPSRYTRASMGFAVSDSPYGPFQLVNVQRMNYRTGGDYDTNTGMARDMGVFLDDTDRNKDGVKDAYAIYSSESNKYMYVSLLNSDYTGPATEGTTDSITLKDGSVVQTFADRVLQTAVNREAPAVFKYNDFYYMVTSGTSGWKANTAAYYRAKSIFGPWEAMGDPCQGGSSDTFVSQPTAVIPVDSARGKFIYMGDRWSYTKINDSETDSAHWDSSYVWLPIEINKDDGIIIKNVSDWDLSMLDQPTINTELPAVISSVADLPSEISVTTDAGTFDSPVVWKDSGEGYFEVRTVAGTLMGLNDREVTARAAFAPEHMIYFVDAGAEGSVGSTFYRLASAGGLLKNKEFSDQAYSAADKWGYLGSHTRQRESAGRDHYQRLRYVPQDSSERTISYQFDDLKDGTYAVYLGFYDPESWYKDGKRIAKITLRQQDRILKSAEAACGGKGSGTISAFEDVVLQGTGGLKITLEPKNTGEGSDVQISWIAIMDHTKHPVVREFQINSSGAGTQGDTIVIPGSVFLSEETPDPSASLQEQISKITWNSSDSAVASVTNCNSTAAEDQRSAALAISVALRRQGTAMITGTTAEGFTASCQITVNAKKEEPGQGTDPGENSRPKIPINLSGGAKMTLSKNAYTYTGTARKPSVTVTAGGVKLRQNIDYKVSYKNNKKIGTAYAVATGMGAYSGQITKTFQINPKGISISGKITARPGGFTVKWKKQTKNITGYQIRYSTSKKFAKKSTTMKSVKKSSSSLTAKKLKPKKKYYVQIRTYQKVKGVNYCSRWSKTKSVVTKKR